MGRREDSSLPTVEDCDERTPYCAHSPAAAGQPCIEHEIRHGVAPHGEQARKGSVPESLAGSPGDDRDQTQPRDKQHAGKHDADERALSPAAGEPIREEGDGGVEDGFDSRDVPEDLEAEQASEWRNLQHPFGNPSDIDGLRHPPEEQHDDRETEGSHPREGMAGKPTILRRWGVRWSSHDHTPVKPWRGRRPADGRAPIFSKTSTTG